MIIEIESVYGDKILYGKRLSFSEIKKITHIILSETCERDFPSVICARLGFEELEDSDVTADCVIDLDTHTVYVPQR